MTANASRDERNCGYSGVPAEPFFRGSKRERERDRGGRREGRRKRENELYTFNVSAQRRKKKGGEPRCYKRNVVAQRWSAR